MEDSDFSSLSQDQLYEKLQSSCVGLSADVAARRLKEQSRAEKTENRFRKEFRLLLRQYTNPLVLLLAIAVLLSFLLGESSDSLIIFFILLVTGLLGFWQELNAGRAMDRLRRMIQTTHVVLRDEVETEVSTEEIVPGDIVLLDAGDIIPADCSIIECRELHVNESSLTGESFPVEKSVGVTEEHLPVSKKYNCLWHGTNVVSGTARAIAVKTGNKTIFGGIAQSLQQSTETSFEKGIRKFGFFLLRITIVLSIVILVVNLYFHKPLFDAVLFSLALAVGMAPELLPAIMTFSMSRGAKKMAEKKVIVKKLSSIFNYGEVNVLCTDKTGTITEGAVTVKDILDADGNTNERIRLFAVLNARLQNGFTNPVDKAIGSLNISIDNYKKTDEIPYDFIRKRLSIAVSKDQQHLIITKGAFTNVLDICNYSEAGSGEIKTLEESQRTQLQEAYIEYSRQGYRVLGLAYKQNVQNTISRNDENQMVFLGFILLEDPLKETTLSSIRRLENLFIDVKIITGDNRYAALHTAQKIGLNNPVILTGEELKTIYPEALILKVKETDVFAEIEPQQKELIVKSLQKSGLVVAYVGDGINDVAAINAADVGISTNNSSDVAREAADFVLMEKDLSVLADGIVEGRRSFVNSMKYILITTGATFGNMLSVAGASLFLPFLPMLPKQILLTNLITDFPFLAISSDNVEKQLIERPGKWNLKMIRNFMIVFGLHSSLFDFIIFYLLYFYFKLTGSLFQTGWFLESVITELLILFIIRTRKSLLTSRPGKLLLSAALISFCVVVYLPYSPLANALGLSVVPYNVLMAIGITLITYTITADLLKILFFRVHLKNQ